MSSITISTARRWLKQGINEVPWESIIRNPGSPKPGGVLNTDAQGNKAWVYPDGTFDEVK